MLKQGTQQVVVVVVVDDDDDDLLVVVVFPYCHLGVFLLFKLLESTTNDDWSITSKTHQPKMLGFPYFWSPVGPGTPMRK